LIRLSIGILISGTGREKNLSAFFSHGKDFGYCCATRLPTPETRRLEAHRV
jgi:hypothetical protein|tara:strand:- start:162 stop:314 length:153 start_codon:yes stop_codon:yes gene_type:complete